MAWLSCLTSGIPNSDVLLSDEDLDSVRSVVGSEGLAVGTHRDSNFAHRDVSPGDTSSIQSEPLRIYWGDSLHFLAIPPAPVQLLNLAP